MRKLFLREHKGVLCWGQKPRKKDTSNPERSRVYSEDPMTTSAVARLFGFGPRDLLEFEAGETADVNVKELFET